MRKLSEVERRILRRMRAHLKSLERFPRDGDWQKGWRTGFTAAMSMVEFGTAGATVVERRKSVAKGRRIFKQVMRSIMKREKEKAEKERNERRNDVQEQGAST